MEHIWYQHYPAGVPETINPDTYSSLVDFLEKNVARYPERTVFSNFGASISYRELDHLSKAFAAYLQKALGLAKGERVAIMMPNLMQYPVAMFGILRAGCVVVNVNPLYTAKELEHQLNDADVETLIVVENFANTVEQALPHTKLKNIIVTRMGDLLGGVKKPLMNFIVKHVKKMVPAYHIQHVKFFNDIVKQGKKLSLSPVVIHNDDLAYLQYTGGTTGPSKGAMLTHRNMIANVLQCVTWMRSVLEQGDNVVIGALPLYHIFSLTVCCMCFMLMGSECVLVTNPRDMNRFIKILQKTKFSIFVGLNTLFNGLMNHSGFDGVDFSRIKLTISGGMALQKTVADRWQALTGSVITEGYGLTEASPVITINPMGETCFNASVGMPVSSTDVMLRDEEGKELALGETGEIWVHGPQVMKGYWRQADETANVIDRDGWLRTGDIGRFDERGYLYIVDRKKDMIVVSGFNVYPNEIEEVISQLPGVDEVAVIGVPSEKTGEAIKAFITKKDPDLTEQKVLTHCRESLTNYKIPKQIEFREVLPKSNVGKILRRELKKEAVPA